MSGSTIALKVRNPATGSYVDNFHLNAWRVRYLDPDTNSYVWIRMTPNNTKIKNPDHDPAEHDPQDPDYPDWLIPASE